MDNTDIATLRCRRCGHYWGSNCGPEENFQYITILCPTCVQIVSDSHLDLADPPAPRNPRRPMVNDMGVIFDLELRGFKIKYVKRRWYCYAPRNSCVGEHSTAKQGWWYPAPSREAAQIQIRSWMQQQDALAELAAAQ